MMFTDSPAAWLPVADAVVKVTLVLAIAGAAALALRSASAALRHLVWSLAVASALLLPVLTFALPKAQLPLFTIPVDQPGTTSPAVEREADSLGPGAASSRAPTETDRAAPGRVPAPIATQAGWPGDGVSWPTVVVLMWGIGALTVVARLVAGVTAVRWIARRAEEVTDAPWLPAARLLAARLGITSRLRIRRSGSARMPLAAGVIRPSIILPADADGWPETRVRTVLLHELSHVKRRDCLTHVIAQLACALHWFNPLVWIAVRRLRMERERACDDLVLASGVRGTDYANELLDLARAMRADRFPALLAGASLAVARRSQLEGRLVAILDPALPRGSVSHRCVLVATVLCGGAVAPLAALQPWAAAPAETQTSVAAISVAVEAKAAELPPGIGPTDWTQAPLPPQPAPAPAPIAPAVSGRPAEQQAPQPLPDVIPPIAEAAIAAAADAVAGLDLGLLVAEALGGALQGPDPQPEPGARPRPAARARQLDPRTVAALTDALRDSDKDVREAALHALVALREPLAFGALVQALRDASADLREYAAYGLGQLRDRRAVEPLTGALKDPSPAVREQAAFALGRLRDASTADALALALRDSNAGVREQAAFALGQLRDRRAVEPLIPALKDANASVREQAAFALGQLRDRTAVDALVVAARDASADVREQVIFALAQIRDPRAIDALTAALKDESARVRQQAAFALGRLAR